VKTGSSSFGCTSAAPWLVAATFAYLSFPSKFRSDPAFNPIEWQCQTYPEVRSEVLLPPEPLNAAGRAFAPAHPVVQVRSALQVDQFGWRPRQTLVSSHCTTSELAK
jgi:hypothetical protein